MNDNNNDENIYLLLLMKIVIFVIFVIFAIFAILAILAILVILYKKNPKNKKNIEQFKLNTDTYDIVIQSANQDTRLSTTYIPPLSIPKKIWAFWDGDELPETVQLCVQSWKVKNPSYSVIILSKKSLKDYLPDVDFTKIKHISDSVARFSDMIRLFILEKYGGIWCDASIICLEPFDTWLIPSNNIFDFIGFYIDSFTDPRFKSFSPVIESWFLACPPNSLFIKDWLAEFLRISSFETVGDYVKDIQSDTNTQKIDGLEYLSIHVACQKVLQKNLGKYNIALFKAEDTAFKYLTQSAWNSQQSIHNIINCASENIKKPELLVPILKLRGCERGVFEKIPNKNEIFKFLLNS